MSIASFFRRRMTIPTPIKLSVQTAVVATLSLLAAFPAPAQEEDSHPGAAVFAAHCATCHEGGDPRAVSVDGLNAMTADTLRFALTAGLMQAQGQRLTEAEREDVIDYLAVPPVSGQWLTDNRCSESQRSIDLAPVSLANAGGDLQFSRNLSAEQSGLNKSDMADLELAWALGLPGIGGLRSTPVIAGGTLFYPAAATEQVLAIDTVSGCLKWAYDAGASLRSSMTLSDVLANGERLLYVTDERARLHAIDPLTGDAAWVIDGAVDEGVHTRLTGAPLFFEQRLYLPVSASGVQRGAEATHECCDGRGAVVAMDGLTGETVWTYYTMPLADYTGQRNAVGTRLRGPSGAPIWSSPSLDEKRRLLYVTTGENTSLPATDTSNAIIALDLDSGDVRWQFQAVANDVWNMACTGREYGPNCPSADDSIIKDWDFGSAATLVTLADGSERLVAGQKSGHLWALRPDDGSVVWQQRVGDGGALGGNHWGIAVDGERVFLPINDPHYASMTDDMVDAGVYAFDLDTGGPVWAFRARPDCANGRNLRVETCQERYGFSALPLVVDGALVAGNIDGRLFVFDGENGDILFEFDSSQSFATVNNVEAHGGAFDSHTIAAGAGMVFVGSGYDRFRQQAGNVLLAFRPRR
ncbi:PQQ-binding-like beta-propeller repeat protein [Pseudohongiella acticola]|jgi:polyvinyl alcohol dehydrogenase (cytochrome)|uniref:outer membrane protein assembly factor BamB family protein n=1 Tax=Pseudohongiella acticola TaxID=1524254 RepID=UPI0030ECB54F